MILFLVNVLRFAEILFLCLYIAVTENDKNTE